MAIPATQMRPGMIIKHNNDLHSVVSVEHRTPGSLRAFIQAKLRNIRTCAMFERRFRSGDAIERINVDEIPMEYLYQDGDSYCMGISATLILSMASPERKRCSNMAPVRILRSLAWIKARRLPGVRCSTLNTE